MKPECAYADHNGRSGGVQCTGPVILTAHDQRGCRRICFAHAQWIMTNSIIGGHSSNCPEVNVPTKLGQEK